jgi:hypothetical protein
VPIRFTVAVETPPGEVAVKVYVPGPKTTVVSNCSDVVLVLFKIVIAGEASVKVATVDAPEVEQIH